MTEFLKLALRQIEGLSEGDQNAAAGALLDYVRHRRDVQLSEEQIDEVRRRISNPDRKLLSLDEVRGRIARLRR